MCWKYQGGPCVASQRPFQTRPWNRRGPHCSYLPDLCPRRTYQNCAWTLGSLARNCPHSTKSTRIFRCFFCSSYHHSSFSCAISLPSCETIHPTTHQQATPSATTRFWSPETSTGEAVAQTGQRRGIFRALWSPDQATLDQSAWHCVHLTRPCPSRVFYGHPSFLYHVPFTEHGRIQSQ